MARLWAGAALSALLIAGLAGGVSAASINTNTRLLGGPGTGYAQVGVLSRGATVTVSSCRSGWCYVRHGRQAGWVHAPYISGAVAGSYRAVPGTNLMLGPPKPAGLDILGVARRAGASSTGRQGPALNNNVAPGNNEAAAGPIFYGRYYRN